MKFYEFNEKEKRIDIFNERYYRHPKTGKFYRNVTTILGIIDKGYNYEEWLKNNGHNAEIIVDRAGTFGTTFHAMVQSFLSGNTISYYDNKFLGDRVATELWERFNLWINFWQELNQGYKVEYKKEAIEYITYSEEHEYAGTVDLICRLANVPAIFDWKTGNTVGNKEELQLTAYMKSLNINKGYIVHLPAKKPNKKGYKIIEVDFTEDKFNLFLATKKVFDMENKDSPKVLTLPLELSIEDFTNDLTKQLTESIQKEKRK